jgi:hypothetical protein
MKLELNDEQTELLIREVSRLIDNDRYFLGPRARVLKEILGKLRPEPERPEPRPPLRNYEPPRMGRWHPRRG